MFAVQAGEIFRFEQEVYFDGHLYGPFGEWSFGGEIQIRRGSDGFYWDGAAFVAADTWIDTTIDSSFEFHYYDFQIPLSGANGDTYNVRIRVTFDKETESVGNLIIRPATTGGGGGGEAFAIFDAVDFATGFPSTVG